MSRILPLLGTAGLLLLAACGREPVHIRVDRVHDLVTLLKDAEFSEGSIYRDRQVATIDSEDSRDGITYIRMPSGTSASWHSLATDGPVQLKFGYGVAWTRDKVQDRPVRFRIEARRDAGEAARWEELFDDVVSPDELTAPQQYVERSISIDDPGPVSWSLRFSTALADELSGRVTWPGWFSPRLCSDGREVALEQMPVPTENVVLDLIGGLGEAQVLAENASSTVARASLDAALGVATAGGARTSVRAAAPARIRYRVSPPAGSRLRFAIGVDTKSGWKLDGDGMTFAVEIDGERVFESTLRPRTLARQRGWHPATIDLDRWAGQKIELDLVTEPLGDSRNDVGGFAHPLLFQRRDVARLEQDQAPTVLLVLVDTLRADRLGAPDEELGTPSLTPRLDRLLAQGVSFPDARTVTSWTWPTIASLFTGLYPRSHGVHTGEGFFLTDQFETLAERFQHQGYTTAAFVSSLLIGEPDNFQQGFETFAHTPYVNAAALNERFLSWLDNTEGLARFAYLHYFDPHHPYQPPAAWMPDRLSGTDGASEAELAARLKGMAGSGEIDRAVLDQWLAIQRRRYDAEVRYFDQRFGELIDTLEQRGVLEHCIIAFTSDHGEEFYEHGLTDHGGHLFDETVRVPLFITGFGRSRLEPRQVDQPVEIRHLYPTLQKIAGLADDRDPGDSIDLLGTLLAAPVFGHTCHGREQGIEGWTDKDSILRNGWKLIHTPASDRYELYHLETDPAEQVDRSLDEPRVAEALRAQLEAWRRDTVARRNAARIELDQEAVRMMEQLGYIEK